MGADKPFLLAAGTRRVNNPVDRRKVRRLMLPIFASLPVLLT